MHSSAVFGVGYRQQGNAKAGVFCSSTFCLMGAPAGRFKVGHWDVTVKKCEVRMKLRRMVHSPGVWCAHGRLHGGGEMEHLCVSWHILVCEKRVRLCEN